MVLNHIKMTENDASVGFPFLWQICLKNTVLTKSFAWESTRMPECITIESNREMAICMRCPSSASYSHQNPGFFSALDSRIHWTECMEAIAGMKSHVRCDSHWRITLSRNAFIPARKPPIQRSHRLFCNGFAPDSKAFVHEMSCLHFFFTQAVTIASSGKLYILQMHVEAWCIYLRTQLFGECHQSCLQLKYPVQKSAQQQRTVTQALKNIQGTQRWSQGRRTSRQKTIDLCCRGRRVNAHAFFKTHFCGGRERNCRCKIILNGSWASALPTMVIRSFCEVEHHHARSQWRKGICFLGQAEDSFLCEQNHKTLFLTPPTQNLNGTLPASHEKRNSQNSIGQIQNGARSTGTKGACPQSWPWDWTSQTNSAATWARIKPEGSPM